MWLGDARLYLRQKLQLLNSQEMWIMEEDAGVETQFSGLISLAGGIASPGCWGLSPFFFCVAVFHVRQAQGTFAPFRQDRIHPLAHLPEECDWECGFRMRVDTVALKSEVGERTR